MPEYSLGFSRQLIEAAKIIRDTASSDPEANRTILYLSLLSIEISLKAIMEEAGIPVSRLRKLSHSHKKLLEEIEGKCEVEVEVTPGNLKWVSCSRLRAVTIDPSYSNATLGVLLQAESAGASINPNQIRYGSSLKHYPPEVMLEAAVKLLEWVGSFFSRIRKK